MEDHVRELLNRYKYSDEVKESVAFRVLFGGEDAKQIMQELGIHSVKTIHHWEADYQQKIEQGLMTRPEISCHAYSTVFALSIDFRTSQRISGSGILLLVLGIT